jgi:putative radical SAM enzyme (TIGR03279 family)
MTYPQHIHGSAGARIAAIQPDSPAALAGLKPGMTILGVDGEPLNDILDWQWLTDDVEVVLEYKASSPDNAPPNDAPIKLVVLHRNPGEAWGIEFSDVLFDGLRRCVNSCSFCFMRMLPKGMRPTLYVRDDDYRLSFLHGNFVTLTNLSDEDIERVIRMRLSPLHVSLHAVDPAVRRHMMGSNHARGIEMLEQLLAAGIEFKAQIVLMPGVNDGAVLDETLIWIAARPGITATGVVPYGHTRYARVQQGFDAPESARAIIRQLEHLAPQVQLADEFYLKAWPGALPAHLPAASYYGEFPLLEDGIGMVRQFVDRYGTEPVPVGLGTQEEHLLVTGEAFAAVLHELWPAYRQHILPIKNDFFGGNVDVAGLLTAKDIIRQAAHHKALELVLPSAMFNDEGLTLDDKTAADIAEALDTTVAVLEC